MNEKIKVVVTFLCHEQGGRETPARLTGGIYRPHLVVEDVINRFHKTDDDYIGVCFEDGPESAVPGAEWEATATILFRPREVLPSGSTFTIREGHKVVGFGTVMAWVS